LKKAPRQRSRREVARPVKPPALHPGERVGLVCPASRPASPAVLKRCLRVVEELELAPVLGTNVLASQGCMAGSDEQRLADLNGFLADDSIAGIFCITGGYGSLRLISGLDYAAIARRPKIIAGCDDNCHLLLAVHAVSHLVTFHGPNLDQIASRYTFEHFRNAVMKKGSLKRIAAADLSAGEVADREPYTPVPGTAAGALLGGNLTALTSLFGTPFQPDLTEAILFLEDRNERTDILDRWLTTLHLSGQLARASGVAFGQFAGCGSRGSLNLLSIEELFGDLLEKIGKPCCFGLPVGQGQRSATLPLGIRASFDATGGIIEIGEPATS